MTFYIGADGTPQKMELVQGSGSPEIDQAALQFASTCQYKPRMVNGLAVWTGITPMRVRWNSVQ
jgi:TonB family protein